MPATPGGERCKPRTEEKPWWEDDPRFTGRFKTELRVTASGGCTAPSRAGQFGAADELLGLHRAPGRHVGVGRRVVGQHRHDRPQRDVPDLLGQHDDGDGALTPQGVDGQRSRRAAVHHGPFGPGEGAGVGTRLARYTGRGSAPEQAPATPGSSALHAIMPAARARHACPGAKMTQTCGVVEGSPAARDTVCTTRCSRTEEGPRLDYRHRRRGPEGPDPAPPVATLRPRRPRLARAAGLTVVLDLRDPRSDRLHERHVHPARFPQPDHRAGQDRPQPLAGFLDRGPGWSARWSGA